MKHLRALLMLGLMAAPPVLAQRSAAPGGGMGFGRESVADVLTRRARVLDDTLGLDDTQEARLRTFLADHLDTLAARAARTGAPQEGRRPRAGSGRPGTGATPDGFDLRDRAPRSGRRAPRPGDLDVMREPLFATLDRDVRALLTPEQAVRYDAFRARERERAEAFRAARPEGRAPRDLRDAP